MLIVVSQIIITQTASANYPTRTKQLVFNSIVEYTADDGWEDLTNQAKISLPKISVADMVNEDMAVSNSVGSKVHLGNVATNLGGFSTNVPMFLRGDQVQITSGYIYPVQSGPFNDSAVVFQGFISKVKGGKPFEIQAEDNMWLCKQAPAIGGVNGVFSWQTYTVEAMVAELFKNAGLPFTVNALTSTNIGVDFRVDNLTIAQVIEKLRKETFFRSYFRGNEWRCGAIIYTDTDSNTYNFDFAKNIIDNELIYQRKDDLTLSAIGVSTNTVLAGTTTKDGQAKTKKVKLQVLCTYKNNVFTSIVKQPGDKTPFPANVEGERHTFPFVNITDPNVLIARTQAQLTEYYYTGYRGTFKTFGVPYCRMGDKANLTDAALPERNGLYMIKHVAYSLSMDDGLRQVIKLDYKLNTTS